MNAINFSFNLDTWAALVASKWAATLIDTYAAVENATVFEFMRSEDLELMSDDDLLGSIAARFCDARGYAKRYTFGNWWAK